ncbi:hypothetical protein CfE428DRAFT_1666 [Chthoniobacter flavus Ellin428]|uniref:Uncharacterized protein n=1 Tax=Chthoniobacter flavus Ellin428 TaxID=497964 RepID=B4CYC8_9BACT|nr:hypothetical protein CfE428DRAFT_1666 [Chthoniobacter flavus Ellin428]
MNNLPRQATPLLAAPLDLFLPEWLTTSCPVGCCISLHKSHLL